MLLRLLLAGLPVEYPDGSCLAAEVERIEYDSRKAASGCLFVCMPGARADGHVYAPLAYTAGCRLFLCEHPITELPHDAVQLLTENTRALLPTLSARFYGHPADELHLIGITGTKGKTTTALLTTAILNATGHPCAYIGSNGVMIRNRHLETANTTPESRDLHLYFRMMADAGIRYVAMEVSSQALAHHRADGLHFEVTAFLNLSRDHIGPNEHLDFDDYLSAKAKLFTDFGTDHIVCNTDDPYTEEVLRGSTAPRVTFAIDNAADFRGGNLSEFRDETSLGVCFDCRHAGVRTPVRLRSPGEFSVDNALAAISICSCFGVTPAEAAQTLAVTSVSGRFEMIDALPGRTLIVDYAHNGVSLRRALTVLRAYKPERILCVFGSVGGRTKERREELGRVAAELADYSIITSDNPDFEQPEAIIRDIAVYFPDKKTYEMIPNRDAAIRRAIRLSQPGDIVLFAGKGHERYQLVCGKRIPFNERDIIMDECALLTAAT